MATADLKYVYYSVPIATSCREFLRFTWKGTTFQYTCLPNGLLSALEYLQNSQNPALSELRINGHLGSTDIDVIFSEHVNLLYTRDYSLVLSLRVYHTPS